MAIDTKDNLNNALNMEKVLINLIMVIYIEEHIKMENRMDMGSIFGQTVVLIKVNLKMVSEMEKAFGENRTKLILILTMDNSLIRKNKVMVLLFGLMVVNILEISKMT